MYDLAGLAGQSPISLNQSNREAMSSSGGRQRVSLADFTKQRAQMQALERQYGEAIPSYDIGQSGNDEHDDLHGGLLRGSALTEGYGEGGGGGYEDRIADSCPDGNELDGELSELQADREKEFLGLFCESLSGYPEEVGVHHFPYMLMMTLTLDPICDEGRGEHYR